MRAPGQSVTDAYIMALFFVFDAVLTAHDLQQEYVKNGGKGFSPDALYAIGIAIHTVTDNTSPEHAGFQVWHGLNGFFNIFRAAQHGLRESSIIKAQRDQAIKDGRRIFQMAFGPELSAVAFRSRK
jgi:hypothetical protein